MRNAIAVLVAAVLGGSALGMMLDLEVGELDAGAGLVVVGTVVEARSSWNADRSAIYTDVTIEPEQTLKGDADARVVVRLPGGEVGDIGMWVEDTPELIVGDRVRFYLAPTAERGVYELFGAYQGAWVVGLDGKPVKPAKPPRVPTYYSYSGYHRADPWCDYHVNSGVPSGWLSSIQSSGAAWNAAGSVFRFNYQGGTSATGPALDDVNVLAVDDLGAGGTIAANYYWYIRRGKIVVENDIIFNSYYAWSTSGEPGKMDVQNICTHEMGHSLVLNDLYKSDMSEMTMYGYADYGETKKRTLEQGDRDGIVVIYGAGADAGDPARMTRPATLE